LLSATLQCIVAQRLVRILCQSCRVPSVLDVDLFANNPRYQTVKLKGRRCWNPGRCERCAGTGYIGRRAVFEVLRITDEIRHMTSQNATELEIEAKARDAGMTSMVEDGVRKVLAGETSLDEVLRVTSSR
jgi:general secretion pathway protein E